MFDLELEEKGENDFPYVIHKKGIDLLLDLLEHGPTETKMLLKTIIPRIIPLKYIMELLEYHDDIHSLRSLEYLPEKSKFVSIFRPSLLRLFYEMYLMKEKPCEEIFSRNFLKKFLIVEADKLKYFRKEDIIAFETMKMQTEEDLEAFRAYESGSKADEGEDSDEEEREKE